MVKSGTSLTCTQHSLHDKTYVTKQKIHSTRNLQLVNLFHWSHRLTIHFTIENQTERLPNLTSTSPIVPLECTFRVMFTSGRARADKHRFVVDVDFESARTPLEHGSLSTNDIRASSWWTRWRTRGQGIVKDKKTWRWTGNKTEYAGLRRWNRHAYKVFSKLLTSNSVFAVHVEHTITLFANAVWSGRTVLAMLRG